MSAPICTGCGGLGVSLGDVRFCARCLGAMKVEATLGIVELYLYLGPWLRFREWERTHEVPA